MIFPTGVANPVSIKATPTSKGLFILSSNGTVTTFGDAPHLGNATLPHTAVTMAVAHGGQGYWVFDANGCPAYFGDAPHFVETICTLPLNGPVLDAATTPTGSGYWLVASDGGVFSFNAPFMGSMGGQHLNGPVVGMAPAPDGSGYWEVATDGGIFSFGVPFLGSMGSTRLNKPVVGMVASGTGYMMVAADGGVFNFGNPFFGSLGTTPPPSPIVSIAPSYDSGGTPNGYWMMSADGTVYAFGSAWTPPPVTTIPGDGTYRVNIDIAPGTYRTANTTSTFCSWQRLSGFSGSFADVIGNSSGAGRRVVTISPTDVGFWTSGCGAWTTSTAPSTGSLTAPLAGDGVYRVGIDIAAGVWTSTGNIILCTWQRLSKYEGLSTDVLASDFGSGTRIVTVSPTDAGLRVSGCTTFNKTS